MMEQVAQSSQSPVITDFKPTLSPQNENTTQTSKLSPIISITDKIPKQSFIPIINEHNQIVIGKKVFDISLPIFQFIINNPMAERIPSNLLSNCITETNYLHQTPLMLSVIIGNINFVRQLIPIDIGKIDDDDHTALDYAYEYHASNDIINLLEEYEYNY